MPTSDVDKLRWSILVVAAVYREALSAYALAGPVKASYLAGRDVSMHRIVHAVETGFAGIFIWDETKNDFTNIGTKFPDTDDSFTTHWTKLQG